jgi:hypothetical protein
LPTEDQLRTQLHRYSQALDCRIAGIEITDAYYDGNYPLPPLVQEAKVTRAYKTLMALCDANWPKLIVDSVEERLEVQGIRFSNDEADDDAWEIWQENGLDAESSMIHQAALTNGRAFALVWGDGSDDPKPRITYEHASTCIVEYSRDTARKRVGGLRRWREGKQWFANLYLPDAVYKFQATGDEDRVPTEANKWVRREVRDETWPLPNTLGEVPLVEFAVNRSLRPSAYGMARGEFEPNLRHIDRIHYKIFCGLIALTWSGFPLRYVIGDPILYATDNEGNEDRTKPIPPFDAVASAVAQFENPGVTVGQLPEATIDNYSPEMDIKHLAALTKTPAHYLLGEMVNLSADAIRAGEAGLVSKVRRHQRPLGESHEDVTRLAFKVKDPNDPRGGDQSAQIIWKDPESRSLAERADAATKLAAINMPWQTIGQYVLGMTPQEIMRAEAGRGSDVLQQMLAKPELAASGNGAGA